MMKKYFLLNLLLSILLYASECKIDYSYSNITFKIKHLSVANAFRVIKDFSGKISINEGKINLRSIDTLNTQRNENLFNGHFFKHSISKVRFLESSPTKIKLNLEINNVKKDVWLDYKITGLIKNPNNA